MYYTSCTMTVIALSANRFIDLDYLPLQIYNGYLANGIDLKLRRWNQKYQTTSQKEIIHHKKNCQTHKNCKEIEIVITIYFSTFNKPKVLKSFWYFNRKTGLASIFLSNPPEHGNIWLIIKFINSLPLGYQIT